MVTMVIQFHSVNRGQGRMPSLESENDVRWHMLFPCKIPEISRSRATRTCSIKYTYSVNLLFFFAIGAQKIDDTCIFILIVFNAPIFS